MSLVSWNPYAVPDTNHSCSECFSRIQKTMLRDLRQSESSFAEYRWTEQKIRHLYYDSLWQSRTDQNHPLDKVTREKGRIEEKKLLNLLTDYEKRSRFLIGRTLAKLQLLVHADREFLKCQMDAAYQNCVQADLKKLYDTVKALEKSLDHVLETNRDYQTEVARTAASRDGLYAADTLEGKTAHTEFFDRYETHYAAILFEENTIMAKGFETIRRLLTEDFISPDCCFQGPHELPSS